MKQGEDELRVADRFQPLVIEPSNALSATRRVEDILRSLRGDLSVCDPYVDSRTLDLLAECENAESIKLLTVNVQRKNKFMRDWGAFRTQRGDILEVRVVDAGVLHDRYVISGDGMLLFGGSLNGLGKKQTFVVEMGQDVREGVMRFFGQQWARARCASSQ